MQSPFGFSYLPTPTKIGLNLLLLTHVFMGMQYDVTMSLTSYTPKRGSSFFKGKGLFILQTYHTAQSLTYAGNRTNVELRKQGNMQRLPLQEGLHLLLSPSSEKNNRWKLPQAIVFLIEVKSKGGASRQQVLGPLSPAVFKQVWAAT